MRKRTEKSSSTTTTKNIRCYLQQETKDRHGTRKRDSKYTNTHKWSFIKAHEAKNANKNSNHSEIEVWFFSSAKLSFLALRFFSLLCPWPRFIRHIRVQFLFFCNVCCPPCFCFLVSSLKQTNSTNQKWQKNQWETGFVFSKEKLNRKIERKKESEQDNTKAQIERIENKCLRNNIDWIIIDWRCLRIVHISQIA